MATRIFAPSYYDTTGGVFCLLVEHYGMPDQALPMHREAVRLCGTRTASVEEAMRRIKPAHRRRALDLGCAVGASVFKLRDYFSHVVGIDRSRPLLAQARSLQATRETSVVWTPEGIAPVTCMVRLPEKAITHGTEFIEADIYGLPADIGVFDFVMIEKVLECLPDPQRLMAQIPALVAPGGYFMNVSSYRWTHEFTPPEKQLGTPGQAPGQITKLLSPHFTLRHRFNTAFLLDSDTTWLCYGLAEALLYQRH